MPEIETVRIEHDEVPGGMVIEKKDFDPKVHKLFDAPAESGEGDAKPKKAKKAPAESGEG